MNSAIRFSLRLAGMFCLMLMSSLAICQSIDQYYQSQGASNGLGFGIGHQFRSEKVMHDSVRGTITKYYPSGKEWESVPYAHIKKGIVEGRQKRWFENGQLQTEAEYVAGKRHGVLRTYYPNGQARRCEEYANDKQLSGECFAPDGKTLPCPAYTVFPDFPGGMAGLRSALTTRTRYPKEAIEADIQGTVYVAFVVSKEGQVQHVRVTKSVAPILDAEAVRVVNTLRGWTPGRLDGDVADVAFTVPVTFRLE